MVRPDGRFCVLTQHPIRSIPNPMSIMLIFIVGTVLLLGVWGAFVFSTKF